MAPGLLRSHGLLKGNSLAHHLPGGKNMGGGGMHKFSFFRGRGSFTPDCVQGSAGDLTEVGSKQGKHCLSPAPGTHF